MNFAVEAPITVDASHSNEFKPTTTTSANFQAAHFPHIEIRLNFNTFTFHG